ncbi:MAG TPA: histidine kinase dimerization/phospho-acceptor domain-containing protein [Vicinamibacterales bacterium]|jgi:K+-sensing histidine kinase KdpD|nr:histidine kinase dimerization/phospho-acceptor domain-containing protein [Vicinamibacterales bacterium]
MSEPIDPRWPKILSLSVHEFRTPMTVVSGYLRMVLKEKAGPLNDQQRRLLEEAEKSCGRLTALLAEVSELSTLEAGTAAFNKQSTELNAVLATAMQQLPPLPDREVTIDLQLVDGQAPLRADSVKLGQALGAIVAALRRELVTSDRLIVRARRSAAQGSSSYEIFIGDDAAVAALAAEEVASSATFDEWRGGVGLSLMTARRILNAHGGTVHGPADGAKASARILLPGSS